MCVQAGDDDSLDTKFLQENVKVCLEKAAVTAFRNNVILIAELELRDNLCTGCAFDSVVSPDDEFTVNTGKVTVVAENNGNALFTGCVKKTSSGRNYGLATVTSKRSSYEVIEHVNDQDCGFVQFIHFIYL